MKNLVGEIDFSFRAIAPSSLDSDVSSFESEEDVKKE